MKHVCCIVSISKPHSSQLTSHNSHFTLHHAQLPVHITQYTSSGQTNARSQDKQNGNKFTTCSGVAIQLGNTNDRKWKTVRGKMSTFFSLQVSVDFKVETRFCLRQPIIPWRTDEGNSLLGWMFLAMATTSSIVVGFRSRSSGVAIVES